MEISPSTSSLPEWGDEVYYREGWIAHASFLPASENPHEPGSEEFYIWYQGWYDASGIAGD